MADATSAVIYTTKGPIRLELFPFHAPKTVRNFVELAEGTREGAKDPRTKAPISGPYYDGTPFHRVIDGFMQVARKLLGPIWRSEWSDEAKFMTTVALGQQLIFPVLAAGIVALVLSAIGHGYLPGFFRFLLWLWFIGMAGSKRAISDNSVSGANRK